MTKMRTLTILCVFLISFSSTSVVVSQSDGVPDNFDLRIVVRQNFAERQNLINFIKISLQPLGINVISETMSVENWFGIIDQNHKDIDGDLSKWNVGPRIGLFPADDYPAFNYLLEDSGVSFNINQAWDRVKTPSGVSVEDFEEKILDLQLAIDLDEYEIKLDEFAQTWMKELLYYIPLYSTNENYFFSPDLSSTNYQNGILRSIFQGLKWDNPSRIGDPTTLNIARGLVTGNNEMTTPDYSTLVIFDDDLKPHPDLAIQWENSDWVVNDTVTIVKGAHKFIIRDDAYWYQSFPSKYLNFTSQTQKIGPKDFAFAFDLNKPFWVEGAPALYPLSTDTTQRENYALFAGYSLNETENSITFYNEHPSVMDLSMLSRASPIPEFYLNRTIIYNNSLNGTPSELMEIGAHPFLSDTFNEFWRLSPVYGGFSWAGMGISSGPYALTSQTKPEFKLRDDYWYPNEWDSPGGDFIVHQNEQVDPVYNIFNSTESSKQKPTKYHFDILNYNTPESGYNSTSIESKEIDIFWLVVSDDINTFDSLEKSSSVNSQVIKQKNSGEALWFDFENNEHIRKYNVRKAIALAIDKSAIIQSFGGYAQSIDSPIFLGHEKFYTDDWKIYYNYDQARDLMREESYKALENPFLNPLAPGLNTQTILVPEDNLNISVISTILGLLVITVSTRRKLQFSKNNQR